MDYQIDGKKYKVEIVRKANKNIYIRVKNDLTIYVTTSFFTTRKDVVRLLDKNIESLRKMINKICKNMEKDGEFYYLGCIYDIIYTPDIKKVVLSDGYIYARDETMLSSWYKKEIIRIFSDRTCYYHEKFDEKIPFPKLKVRKMKTRWGVCNRKDNSITLNTNLMKYGYNEIDYVIVHELSHFVHFNHSRDFWNIVSKYYPNYKISKRTLKE